MRGAGADGTRRCVWSVMWSYRGIIHVFRRALPVVIVVFVTPTPFVASASVLLLPPWVRARAYVLCVHVCAAFPAPFCCCCQLYCLLASFLLVVSSLQLDL